MTDASVAPRPTPSWRSCLQLVRLPNVFTALADVMMGYLVTHDPAPFPTLRLPGAFWSLMAASACLSSAGMVLNDVFDLEQDRRERPQRPLPSGRVALGFARALGFALLAAGVSLALLAGVLSETPRSGIVAIALAMAILLYDGLLKRTPLAPLMMGSCRALNVLLGMSLVATWHPMHLIIAAGIGVYITGVTWFARTEARESNRLQLVLGTAGMLAGIGLLATYPGWANMLLAEASQPRFVAPGRWPLVWGMVGLLIGWRCVWAVLDPVPQRVQYAVRNSIFSLIVLDAMVTFGVRGMGWAVAVLALLLPTMYLGRWIYST